MYISTQGHLARYLAFHFGLDVTAVEAVGLHLTTAAKFDRFFKTMSTSFSFNTCNLPLQRYEVKTGMRYICCCVSCTCCQSLHTPCVCVTAKWGRILIERVVPPSLPLYLPTDLPIYLPTYLYLQYLPTYTYSTYLLNFIERFLCSIGFFKENWWW